MDERERVLRDAVLEAGKLARLRFLDRSASVVFKGPQDYLSETDAAVERLLKERLLGAFPGDGFLGEEGGGEASPRIWVVDPIDGTANFVRGIAHWCNSVAFVADGVIELGAILEPVSGELYLARRGRGATRSGEPIRVATTPSIGHASVEIGWSTRVPNADYAALVLRVLEAGATFRRTASGALGLAYVADGRADAYVELHINAWDCLAGILLVEEAGGRVSPFLEGGGLLRGNPLLATAPAIADDMERLTGIRLSGSA